MLLLRVGRSVLTSQLSHPLLFALCFLFMPFPQRHRFSLSLERVETAKEVAWRENTDKKLYKKENTTKNPREVHTPPPPPAPPQPRSHATDRDHPPLFNNHTHFIRRRGASACHSILELMAS